MITLYRTQEIGIDTYMKTVCRLYQYRWISHIVHRSQSTRVSSNMPKKKGKSGNDSSQKVNYVISEIIVFNFLTLLLKCT